MDKTKKYLIIAFISILAVVTIISVLGMFMLKEKPVILQGQVEATEIRISGKLPGRIDSFYVKEGQAVMKGDTLVTINCPEGFAKLSQANAMESIAAAQNNKIDEGNRKQIIESFLQLWNKSKSDLELATTTHERISTLYKEGVLTSQRKDESEAVYKAAVAAERAAYQQYQMALDGARSQDRASARSLVDVAKGTVNEVSATLKDAVLLAPENGQISTIYPKTGELIGQGMPIMSLVVLEDAHVVLNVREDLLHNFKMGDKFKGDVPALNKKGITFIVNYISPLGSYATWKSTKESGSYDMTTFELHALPESPLEGLRPGMSVLVNLDNKK
ncbi:HlyD family secretion protein [Dysgonomonas sp. GY617]|uniref:HlyD family secretion protein n=1 Tax=Dysgonomonas sp. GY617 TaxID=2780420 RepID=UPI001883B216|nr:HlyD family efflux transporter periplasmic adaptor subunit [Dysgonomonas sp. GY617]MBF0575054.1 HlyD family efflux transporter periplasmic adaptor subunit [Dysgonomonas sp. GY617]